jgi:hypothetical protein
VVCRHQARGYQTRIKKSAVFLSLGIIKKPLSFWKSGFSFFVLAEWTGLEPATPGVTGRYSNRLNYHS